MICTHRFTVFLFLPLCREIWRLCFFFNLFFLLEVFFFFHAHSFVCILTRLHSHTHFFPEPCETLVSPLLVGLAHFCLACQVQNLKVLESGILRNYFGGSRGKQTLRFLGFPWLALIERIPEAGTHFSRGCM